PDLDLIDAVPLSGLDVTLLPEDTQRRLYDTFHLEIRYNAPRREAILRITIDAETAPALTQAVNTLLSAATPRHSPETAKPAAGSRSSHGRQGCVRCFECPRQGGHLRPGSRPGTSRRSRRGRACRTPRDHP